MMLLKIKRTFNLIFLAFFILFSACTQQEIGKEPNLEIVPAPTVYSTIIPALLFTPTVILKEIRPAQSTLPTPILLSPTQTPIPTLPFRDLAQVEELALVEGGYGFFTENVTGSLDASGVKTFSFYGNESYMSLYSESGNSLAFLFEKKDGSQPIQSVSTAERYYLHTSARGRDLGYVGLDEYLIHVIGESGTSYNFYMTFGFTFHPDLGDPQRIQFHDKDPHTTIRSTSIRPTLDRYVFSGTKGQTVEILEINSFLVNVWLEDEAQNIILRADQNGRNKIVLPADGEYILTVFHNGGEVYAYGEYEFVLAIKN